MRSLRPLGGFARNLTIASARKSLGDDRQPIWMRSYLDLGCLILAGVVFWRMAWSGYQVVLAPEGVAAISIDYWAFLAPLFLWLGMGLLTLRLARLEWRSRAGVTVAVRPVSGGLAPLVAAALSRQSRRIAAGVALTALALAFATSTATFNATYRAQARIDAELTNGADVTVTGTSSAPAGKLIDRLASLAGVASAVPMQHRFAYVGTDLQDLYGIDPTRIGGAATMSDAYFGNGDAKASLRALRQYPNGVFVSEETVTDFRAGPDRVVRRNGALVAGGRRRPGRAAQPGRGRGAPPSAPTARASRPRPATVSCGSTTWPAAAVRARGSAPPRRLVTDVRFSPDGRRLLVAPESGLLRVVAADLSAPPQTIQVDSGLYRVAFAPDGATFVTASTSGTLRSYTADRLVELSERRRVIPGLVSVAFSRDGRWLVVGSDDGAARVWRTDAPAAEAPTVVRGPSPVFGVGFSPDGRQLATASADGKLRFYDLELPRVLARLRVATSACLLPEQRVAHLGECAARAGGVRRVRAAAGPLSEDSVVVTRCCATRRLPDPTTARVGTIRSATIRPVSASTGWGNRRTGCR